MQVSTRRFLTPRRQRTGWPSSAPPCGAAPPAPGLMCSWRCSRSRNNMQRKNQCLQEKVTSGVRNETSGQSWPLKVSYNPCRRVDTPFAAGHTRYGTDEMDFDPVCVDDCGTVVCRAQDRAGEGTGYPRQLGDRECARTYLLVRLGGVHTACDWSGQTVPVDGAKVCSSYGDPHNHVAHDG